jgi:DNA-binding NarL/FixJ family response regulator
MRTVPTPRSDGPHNDVGLALPARRVLGLSLRLPILAGDMLEPVTLTVLVVDDDAAFRGVARRMLAAVGLVVVGEAGTAASAAEQAALLRPDALLIDVGLPDGDGVALAIQLSGLPWHPRVLLTSTDPEAVAPVDVTASGALGFLAKQDLPDAPLAHLFTAS